MQASDQLLAWYDVHAREMPWRTPPQQRQQGVLPDPYHVWLSEVMLQQTTVAAVKAYFLKFTKAWPTVGDLAAAQDSDVMAAWAGLGYYARARNLLKCARAIVADHGGAFPSDPKVLLTLPGIGPYTAASLSSIAFDVPSTVLDGNVERVMARVHAVQKPLPDSKEDLRSLAQDRTPQNRAGDYAQAVMDLGATVCTPRNPTCKACPWSSDCTAYAQGIAETLPRKRPKPVKPTRVGVAYVAYGENGLVLETRPDKGLLGGMLGWPGSDWAVELPEHEPPCDASWVTLNTPVRHTFTHFHLNLTVCVARIDAKTPILRGAYVDINLFSPSSLPTVMRKVWALVETKVTKI